MEKELLRDIVEYLEIRKEHLESLDTPTSEEEDFRRDGRIKEIEKTIRYLGFLVE